MTASEPELHPDNRRWIGPAIVALTGVVMLIWSWGTWPDPVIDFGREVYVPWRLSEGDVLYRDIVSYFNGPLSPYLHARLFKIFGVSLRTLVIFNLVVIALLVTLMYRLLARTAGTFAATGGCAAFFILFAFAQYLVTGNFNYVCPYSYELTHGVTLTLAAIACLEKWSRSVSSPRRWIALAGALLGLVLLTKAEIFAAAVVAMLAGIVSTWWSRRTSAQQIVLDAALFVASAIAPVLIAFLLLNVHLTTGEAMRGILGAWQWTRDRELLNLPYFKELAGTNDVSASVRTILVWTVGYALVFGVPLLFALAFRWMNISRSRATGIAIAAFVFYSVCGFWIWQQIDWNNFIRPLPLMLGAAMLVALFYLARRRASRELVLPFVLLVWSLAMLAKMPLNAHIYHYGFALAMPATIVGIALFVGWLPCILDRFGGNGSLLRATALAAVLLACYVHIRAMDRFWSTKTYTVGRGADAFRADIRGVLIDRAVDELSRSSQPSETLVALPEGLLINYLTRRVNPTGQLNFTPPAIIMYGEGNMLDAIQKHPPDHIAHLTINTSEYGATEFGVDYALSLSDWIKRNYAPISQIRFPGIQGKAFEIELLKRK